MGPELTGSQLETDVGADLDIARTVHALLRLVLAVRFRKGLVLAVMAVGAIVGGLYYLGATRRYSSKAGLLVSQTGRDNLDTSIANEESLRQNAMPTFEGLVRSAMVLAGALQNLPPEDRIDLADRPEEKWIDILRTNMKARAIRATSILEVSYCSKNPQVAANVVRAIVQSYLDFMDRMHKGTAGEISKVLTRERNGLAEQLNRKRQELLEARRHFEDMGFRSDDKAVHPTVQRAVSFNDALMAVQKQRVEQEASLAAIQLALSKGEDLGQYIMSVADTVGSEVLLSSLGLGAHQATNSANMEQTLLAAQAEFQTVQQNLGPNHPEVIALGEKIRTTEHYLQTFQNRLDQRVAELQKGQLGPWLVQIVQQRLDESRRKERILQGRFEEARTEAINLSGRLAQIELLERDVKRLTNMNDVLLNQIASVDLKQNAQEVRVAVIEEPVVVAAPLSPRLKYVVPLTLLGSFGIALALVTLLDALDDRFRSSDEMQSRLGLSVLSMIPELSLVEGGGVESLPACAAPAAREGESFRTLRTTLMLTHQDARQIVITSAEPRDGKSTVLANLAVACAQAGKRTLLIDADLRRPGLTALLNMRGTRGLSEVLRSSGEIGPAVAAHLCSTAIPGLDVIPSGPRPIDPAELLGSPRFSQLLAWAESVYDQVLIDSPPTLATTDTAVIGRLVDGVLVVVQPAKNRRRLVTRVVERLKFLKIPILGLIVNHVSSKDDRGYYGYGYGYGYGHHYHYYYGADDHHASPQVAASEEDAVGTPVSLANAPRGRHTGEDNPPTLLIPRRVA